MSESILSTYAVPAGHFDELLDGDGVPRPWWTSLSSRADLSGAHLSASQAHVARQMHENGVTYNVYAAEDGSSRQWTLDVLPFVVESDEWTALAAGLHYRRHTGRGVYIDLSQVESATYSLAPWLLDYALDGVNGARDGNRSARAVRK